MKTDNVRGRDGESPGTSLCSVQRKCVCKYLKSFTSEEDNTRFACDSSHLSFISFFPLSTSSGGYAGDCSRLKRWADSIDYWSSSIAITGYTPYIRHLHAGMILSLYYTHMPHTREELHYIHTAHRTLLGQMFVLM